ncbi:MAG: Ig-like domain-containing protein [Methanomassiliicoccales archaeon]
MRSAMGVRDLGTNYNIMVDGRGTGLAPPTGQEWEAMESDTLLESDTYEEVGSTEETPSEVDLSQEPYFPPVGDQGGQGSCAAWAMTYYAYGYMEARDQGWTDASSGDPQQLISPAWTYNMVNGGEDKGSSMYRNGQVIEDWGAPPLASMPYDDGDHSSWGDQGAFREAPLHRAKEVKTIDYSSSALDTVKDLVSSNTPVTFAIDASQYSPGFSDGNYIISSEEYDSNTINHAQTIVGYDDSVSDDGETGAFKVVNSWGTNWGDDGFYHLTYEAFEEIGNMLSLCYINDRQDYQPQMLTVWHFDDPPARDGDITIGVGTASSPSDDRTPYYRKDSSHRLPTFMCMDATDFAGLYPGDEEFFLDLGTGSGTVSSLRMELYENGYVPGECTQISPQGEVPLSSPGQGQVSFPYHQPISLVDALGVSSPSTRGDASWVGVPAGEGEAAQSGDVGDGGSSHLSLEVEGPASLTFRWKAPSQPGDELLFSVDSETMHSMADQPTWQEVSVDLSSGNHQLRWTYQKDSSGSGGEDRALVDDVALRPSTIRVDGDSEMESLASSMGLSGDGSESNPYLMERITVDAAGATEALYIGNLSSYLVISDCDLGNASAGEGDFHPGAALMIYDSPHVKVEDTRLWGSSVGLIIQDCQGTQVERSRVTGNSAGILVEGSGGVILTQNLVESNSGLGAELTSSSSCQVYGNLFLGNNPGGGSQATDDSSNQWNSSQIGNHWDDHVSPDGNGDGVVDDPYQVGSATDHLPLSEPVGPPWALEAGRTSSGVELSWSISNYSLYSSVSSQKVYRDLGGEVTMLDQLGAGANSYLDDCQQSERIGYRVEASSSMGVSSGPWVWVEAEDVSPPSLSITSPSNGSWHPGEVTVRWEASDESGVQGYQVRIDGGSWIDKGSETLHTFQPADGEHQVDVKAIDTMGNEANRSVSFGVDTVSPSVDILSPQDSLTGSGEVNLSWEASDALSGVSKVETRVNGGSWVERNGSSCQLSLADGVHDLEVRATDAAGNQASELHSIRVDTTPPWVSIGSPTGPVNSSRVTVEWSGGDSGSGLDRYRVSVDGQAPMGVGLNTSIDLDLAEGEHNITVSALDGAGNQAQDSASLPVDLTSPSIEILSPQSLLNTSTVESSWSSSDSGSGLSGHWIGLDGGEWIDLGLMTEHSFDSVADGEHEIRVRAVDQAGNQITGKVNFTVCTEELDVWIISPDNGTLIDQSKVTVEWGANPSAYGISHFLVRLDGGSWTDVGNETSYSLTVSDGTHLIEVKVVDGSGEEVVAGVNLTVDTTPPSLSLVRPVEGEVINASYAQVEWDIEDQLSGVRYSLVRMDSGSWVYEEGTSHTFTSLADGTHLVEVRGYDMAGNSRSVQAEFSTSTEGLEMDILSPANGSSHGQSQLELMWSASGEVQGFELSLDGGEWADMGMNDSILLNLTDGEHQVRVRALGASENVTASISFLVDTSAPKVEFLAPMSASNSSSVQVEWAGDDALSGLAGYQVRIDGGEWTDVGMNDSALLDLADGVHLIEVNATDALGNWAVHGHSVQVDSTPPWLNLLSPQEEVINHSSPTVEVDSGDEGSGLAGCALRVDGGAWIEFSSSHTLSLSEGEHLLEVRAEDQLGNTVTVNTTLTVDLTPPSLDIVDPADGALLNSSQCRLEWSSSDGLSGVQGHWVRVDGGEWETASSPLDLDLGDGNHGVEVRVSDAAGNRVTVEAGISVDTMPPKVLVDPPGLVSTSNLSVNWTVTEEGSGIQSQWVRVDGGEWTPAQGTEHSLELDDGEHFIEVRVKDRAGHVAKGHTNVTVDTVPPVLNISVPSLVNQTGVNVTWTGGQAPYELIVDGDTTITTDRDWAVLELLEGDHLLTLRAMDEAGNLANSSAEVTVDTTPPSVLEYDPVGRGVDTDTSIRVVFSEPITGINFTVDGIEGNHSVEGREVTFLPANEMERGHTYQVRIEGSDAAGNRLEAYSWFFTTESQGEISGVILDEDGRPVANATVTLDTGETTTTDAQGRFTLQASPGEHLVIITKEGYEERAMHVELDDHAEVSGSLEPREGSLGLDDPLIIAVAVISLSMVAALAIKGRR